MTTFQLLREVRWLQEDKELCISCSGTCAVYFPSGRRMMEKSALHKDSLADLQ